jgi:hypothetical protein
MIFQLLFNIISVNPELEHNRELSFAILNLSWLESNSFEFSRKLKSQR